MDTPYLVRPSFLLRRPPGDFFPDFAKRIYNMRGHVAYDECWSWLTSTSSMSHKFAKMQIWPILWCTLYNMYSSIALEWILHIWPKWSLAWSVRRITVDLSPYTHTIYVDMLILILTRVMYCGYFIALAYVSMCFRIYVSMWSTIMKMQWCVRGIARAIMTVIRTNSNYHRVIQYH